jgi:hypothetical protein
MLTPCSGLPLRVGTGVSVHVVKTIYQSPQSIRKYLKDFLFLNGMHNMKVDNPKIDIRGLSEAETWDTDPIHPRPEVYRKIAEGVIGQ